MLLGRRHRGNPTRPLPAWCITIPLSKSLSRPTLHCDPNFYFVTPLRGLCKPSSAEIILKAWNNWHQEEPHAGIRARTGIRARGLSPHPWCGCYETVGTHVMFSLDQSLKPKRGALVDAISSLSSHEIKHLSNSEFDLSLTVLYLDYFIAAQMSPLHPSSQPEGSS